MSGRVKEMVVLDLPFGGIKKDQFQTIMEILYTAGVQ